MIKSGQKTKNHFIAQGDQLKIDFENYSSNAAKALTAIKSTVAPVTKTNTALL